ncbi:hypothetical protein ALC62_15751 [Cyphomyrmex costatus]|nr:hypothetical protein ALC62_15751 [Cyphomyrmex costatus]
MHATLLFVTDINSFTYSPTLQELALLNQVEELGNAIDIIQEEGLKYIAGYAASRFANKYNHLGTPTEMVVNPQNDWINYISKGRLISSSSELLEVAKIMNKEFQNYHGNFIQKSPGIFKIITDKVKEKIINTTIPREVLLCLIRTRTYIRVRIINKQISAENHKRKHN